MFCLVHVATCTNLCSSNVLFCLSPHKPSLKEIALVASLEKLYWWHRWRNCIGGIAGEIVLVAIMNCFIHMKFQYLN